MQKLLIWERGDIQLYRYRQYSLLYELRKQGIRQCIVISVNEKEGRQQQRACTIKKQQRGWALMDSSFKEIKMTHSEG